MTRTTSKQAFSPQAFKPHQQIDHRRNVCGAPDQHTCWCFRGIGFRDLNPAILKSRSYHQASPPVLDLIAAPSPSGWRGDKPASSSEELLIAS
ncbi:hypothetical protein AVEN_124283-1 [Araneus ventricosus]|uniref:Uncharacterized protein n=1 Tax=Araneus ventricosus TaxID=182803 RepID=A0A4Y2KT62_ARAVE|nr:hypothetical protein AVEN_124283-1 [Araneus ventricosus]